jgi:DNA primase
MFINEIEKRYIEITESLGKLSRFYTECLYGNEEALKYCHEERGLQDSTIRRFGIGYSDSDLTIGFCKRENIPSNHLFLTKTFLDGIANWDRFSNRIVFSIYDLEGRVIGFSGRIFNLVAVEGIEIKKYVNSANSIVYNKSLSLFGIWQARKSILEKGYAIIVEGNLDVVSLSQAGIENVVAPCGTALRIEQLYLLKTLTKKVVCCFDSDSAGQEAKEKSKVLCGGIDLEWQELVLPDVKDPDEFIRKYSKEEFEQLMEE